MTEEIQYIKVTELGPNSRSVNVSLKAMSRNEEREVTSRRDQTTHRVTEILMGDDTGVVFLTAWDDLIDTIEDGKTYLLKNGYTSLFRQNIRLNVGRYGEITESEEEIETVNEEVNVSDQEFDQPPRYRPRSGGGGGGGYRGRSDRGGSDRRGRY